MLFNDTHGVWEGVVERKRSPESISSSAKAAWLLRT